MNVDTGYSTLGIDGRTMFSFNHLTNRFWVLGQTIKAMKL